MTTKEMLLELMETRKGSYLSGEEIAGKLSVSRAAVWKAVKSLQNEGYEILAVPNKGYCLSSRTDVLSPQGIRSLLGPDCGELELEVRPLVDSTNTLLREKARQGAREGYTLLAGGQTQGRGRCGRSFFSPEKTGLYLSILLRPELPVSQAQCITAVAAVAMCEAIEEVSRETPRIKWVNDIYIRGRKVCGILTEAALDLESGMLEYAVLGVGVNVCPPPEGFPEELRNRAGSVFPAFTPNARNRLAAAFLTRFLPRYRAPGFGDYLAQYRRRSLVIGKTALVPRNGVLEQAQLLSIDDSCCLIAQFQDGATMALTTSDLRLEDFPEA